jgi:hypothetical protein
MKYVLCLLLILQASCSNDSVVRDNNVDYHIVERVVDDMVLEYDEDTGIFVITKKEPTLVNAHDCKHKYDKSRNFTYVGQLVSYHRVMYDEKITTYEYTLPSNELHYLSGDEVANYVCKKRN